LAAFAAAALGDYGRYPSASALQSVLNRRASHSVDRKKRLDKEEKTEDKKGNNQLISIEKTGFITYRLSISTIFYYLNFHVIEK